MTVGLVIQHAMRMRRIICSSVARPALKYFSTLSHTWMDNKVRELYIRGIVHYEFVPTGQTVNQVYYLEVLKRLREKVRRKRPELFASNSWILHHDNAPAHTALSVREFLATKQITVLEHPAYSPDLAPSDFFLFPKINLICQLSFKCFNLYCKAIKNSQLILLSNLFASAHDIH